MTRRWRGMIDVPPTHEGLVQAAQLGHSLPLDYIYHDHLSRCAETAYALDPEVTVETAGPRPWHMGPDFEGKEITEESLDRCRYLVKIEYRPFGGESFGGWYCDWTSWLDSIEQQPIRKVGIVTHNRNIQALYSRHNGVFYPHLYDVDGPSFLTVHVYSKGHIAPWNGKAVPPGIYILRHCETEWGT